MIAHPSAGESRFQELKVSLFSMFVLVTLAAPGGGCASIRMERGYQCGAPASEEIAVLMHFESRLAPGVRIAASTVDATSWVDEERRELSAWVDATGWDAWSRRSRCPIDLSGLLPAGRLFVPGRDSVMDEDGWVLLGRVIEGADQGGVFLPVWGVQQHDSAADTPLAEANLFRYLYQGDAWVFRGRIAIGGPAEY